MLAEYWVRRYYALWNADAACLVILVHTRCLRCCLCSLVSTIQLFTIHSTYRQSCRFPRLWGLSVKENRVSAFSFLPLSSSLPITTFVSNAATPSLRPSSVFVPCFSFLHSWFRAASLFQSGAAIWHDKPALSEIMQRFCSCVLHRHNNSDIVLLLKSLMACFVLSWERTTIVCEKNIDGTVALCVCFAANWNNRGSDWRAARASAKGWNLFSSFLRSCLAVAADFLRIYPSTAYKGQGKGAVIERNPNGEWLCFSFGLFFQSCSFLFAIANGTKNSLLLFSPLLVLPNQSCGANHCPHEDHRLQVLLRRQRLTGAWRVRRGCVGVGVCRCVRTCCVVEGAEEGKSPSLPRSRLVFPVSYSNKLFFLKIFYSNKYWNEREEPWSRATGGADQWRCTRSWRRSHSQARLSEICQKCFGFFSSLYLSNLFINSSLRVYNFVILIIGKYTYSFFVLVCYIFL